MIGPQCSIDEMCQIINMISPSNRLNTATFVVFQSFMSVITIK